ERWVGSRSSATAWVALNGSGLGGGRLAGRCKSSGRQSVPARAQHSVSFRAINARQLQALVRPLPRAGRNSIVVARDFGLARSFANLTSQDVAYFLRYARSTAPLRRALRVR